MASEYLASTLLDSMRDTGLLPTSDESFTSARLLAVMNAEQRLYLARLLLSAREEYQVAHASLPLVEGQTRYRIPSRAIGAKLKLVSLIDGNGDVIPLGLATPERALKHGGPGVGYYLEGNSVVLTGALTGSLRLSYFRRMGRIVEASEVGEIESLDATAGTVTLVSKPSAFTEAKSYDFVQGSPHFDTLAVEQSATIASNVLAFAEGLPEGLAVGDYVALAGETPVCQAPLELHGVLVQRAVVKVLQAKGDPKARDAADDLQQMRDDALSLITPRVEAAPVVIVNHFGPGWGRYPRHRRFR